MTSFRRRLSGASLCASLLLAAGGASAGDPAAGERLFNQCKACHSLDPGVTRVGPSLHGLVGRPAGTLEGYAYSDAMKASGIVWGEDSLRSYLADPRGVVPGTKMSFGGVHDATKLDDLIAYLLEATQ